MEPVTQQEADRSPTGPTDVVVVGGGLAGLVASITAARSGRQVTLVDPRPLGGRARCDTRGGFTFNRGPRALYLAGAARSILDDLGVDTSQGVAPTTKGAMGRAGGRLHRLPQGPLSLLRTSLLSPAEKLRFAMLLARLPRLDPTALEGTSFGAFLGDTGLSLRGTDVVRMVARLATYAAEPDHLDASAVVTNLQLALGDGVRYLDGGFQSLVDALASSADQAGVIRWTDTVRSVDASTDSTPARVRLASDHTVEADAVVVAVGTPAAAHGLLGGPIAGDAGLTAPVTAACLELGVRRTPRHPVILGVDEPLYLSTHRAARLAPDGGAVVHVMRYHRADEALAPGDQRTWLRRAATAAGIEDGDVVEERFLADMTVTGGHPTAGGGGLAGRPGVAHPDRPGIFLAGDWVGRSGLLSDAAVDSGAAAGRAAVTQTHGEVRSADTMVR